MQYHDIVNQQGVDAQVLGILVVVPVTGFETKPQIITHKRCENCEKESTHDNFCSHCGGKIVEVTEPRKSYGQVCTQQVPVPDVRQEMSALGIDEHLPFDEYYEDDDCQWVFVYKNYKTIGHRSDFQVFLDEFNITDIKDDIERAQTKFEDVIKKYNGRVVFGLASSNEDW